MDRKTKKLQTIGAIQRAAKEIFLEEGFLLSNTKKIAERAGLAHGTLFLYFKNKEELIDKLLEELLLQISEELEESLSEDRSFIDLLSSYLDMVERNESFLSRVYKELPFYSEKLQQFFLFKEGSLRRFFYESYERGMKNGQYKELDITELLILVFGSLQNLVAQRDLISDGNIVAQHREQYLKTISILISNKKE